MNKPVVPATTPAPAVERPKLGVIRGGKTLRDEAQERARARAIHRAKPDLVTFTVTMERRFTPAFRSAIDEISDEVGERLKAPHDYDVQDALTEAAVALGILRAAVFPAVPAAHPNYKAGRTRR
jgi:hypothetical protein